MNMRDYLTLHLDTNSPSKGTVDTNSPSKGT